jgi:hypothetical protein
MPLTTLTTRKETVLIMTRNHLTARAAALATVVVGLTVALTGSSGAAHAAPAGSGYVLYDCGFRGQVKPATEVLTCADAGIVLESLRWASWTPRFASASGTLTENDCKPSCVQGHFHNYPAVVVLWGSGSVPGHPALRRYTHLTLIFTGARPPVYATVNGKIVARYPVTQNLPAI